jgi:uncharacterized protein YcbX
MQVSQIWRYPVKSLGGQSLNYSAVDPIGLASDRRWLVVNGHDRFLTRRELPKMAEVRVELIEGAIVLHHETHGALTVHEPAEGAETRNVTVWRDRLPARNASEEASAFLSQALEKPVRLVWMHDILARPVAQNHGKPGDHVSFADGFPLLLTTQQSLDDLNARLASPVTMRRFRPNIVIAGALPWAEDTWRRIRIGGLSFRVVKPCSRCVIITQDPDTGVRRDANEPLATLRSFHAASSGEIMFGQNVIPDGAGTIRIGDPVEILEEGPSNLL